MPVAGTNRLNCLLIFTLIQDLTMDHRLWTMDQFIFTVRLWTL
jgi:hypothetical protein